MKKVGFEAYIKEAKVKSLVSGDKSLRIVLEVDNPANALVAKVNELHDPTRPVGVALAEKDD
jgi:hypothetical protein